MIYALQEFLYEFTEKESHMDKCGGLDTENKQIWCAE